jgi:hypothetical protein
MIKLIKSAIFSTSILFVTNSFSQEINDHEKSRIEEECFANNQENLMIVREFGNTEITQETLLEKCIKNGIQIEFFKSYNTINDTEELYRYTGSALVDKLNELEKINTPESKAQYDCFKKQIFGIEIINAIDKSRLYRALITANNLLRNNCAQ